jgi:hypothetical protein
MEFSYQVSEAEYLQGCKLGQKGLLRSILHPSQTKKIMFWVFILVCLVLLWAVVQRTAQQPPADQEQVAQSTSSGHSTTELVTNVGPFILLAGIWIFILFRGVPKRLRQ